jgi:hypothetical protein
MNSEDPATLYLTAFKMLELYQEMETQYTKKIDKNSTPNMNLYQQRTSPNRS